ncbi:MAG: HAD-IIB family hydrolase [Pseudomonadota bacterium]
MTRHETFAPRSIHEKELVLATDLDGTFLGGSDLARSQFYRWIEAQRDRIGLIFVTGRDPEFICDLTNGTDVPTPDYVVGDVGSTIARMQADHTLAPIAALEEEIAAAWGEAGPKVREALDGHPGLTLQPTKFRYRVSYDLDPETFDDSAVGKMEAMGLDTITSDNRFFDVLPKGVSKGPSLLRLLDHLGIDHRRALAAGDTLNDLSMLQVGVPAVAVGGSEPALIEAVTGLPHIHIAEGVGVSGIAEAIAHLNLLPGK